MTHSADGLWVSSDYYLRLVKAAGDALKNGGTVGPLNEPGAAGNNTVEHSNGPIFWRNSFERRTGRLGYGASGEGHNPTYTPVRHIEIDVGVPNGSTISNTNATVTGAFTTNRPRNNDGLILNWNATVDNYNPPSTTLGMVYSASAGGSYSARSGDSAFRLAGNKTSTGNAEYIYKIANTRIKANSNMSLTFWIKTENAQGGKINVELKRADGVLLNTGYTNTGTPDGNGWQKRTVAIPAGWSGNYITEIIIAFRDDSSEIGGFAALIDDIMIANN